MSKTEYKARIVWSTWSALAYSFNQWLHPGVFDQVGVQVPIVNEARGSVVGKGHAERVDGV